jgi:hypothetical protein
MRHRHVHGLLMIREGRHSGVGIFETSRVGQALPSRLEREAWLEERRDEHQYFVM